MINAIILISVFVGGSLLYYYLSVKPRMDQIKGLPAEKREANETKPEKRDKVQKDEIVAAIALALNLYSKGQNEEEKTVLTLKTVAKLYSPWSSKIYGLRKYPR